jgi:hypothetical protein
MIENLLLATMFIFLANMFLMPVRTFVSEAGGGIARHEYLSTSSCFSFSHLRGSRHMSVLGSDVDIGTYCLFNASCPSLTRAT